MAATDMGQFIETAPDAMLVVDSAGTIVVANARANALFGAEDLVGSPVDALVPADLADHHARLREGFARQPTPREMGAGRELEARRIDGSQFPVEISLGLVGEADDQVVSVAVRDISERRRAEARAAQFEFVVAATKEAIVVTDLQGRVTAWNRSAERVTGRPAEGAIGALLAEVLPLDDSDLLTTLGAPNGLGAEVENARAELRRADGRTTPVSVSASAIVDRRGEVQGRSILVRDIAEELEMQSVLAEVQDHRRETERLANIGTWAWDRATDEVQWSAQLHEIVGVAPLDFDGRMSEAAALLDPDHRDAVVGAFQEAVAHGHSFSIDAIVVRPDGESRWVSMSGDPVLDTSGAVIQMSGICQDITQRQEAVEALRAADALKDEFLGIVSHELRTPLTSILGFGRLLHDTASETQKTYAEVMLRNADEMHGMIERILDFTRVQSGRIRVDVHPVPIRELIDEIQPLLKLAMAKHELVFDLEEDLLVPVDPAGFRRIAVNLLTNAAKFTPAGGRITLRAFTHHGAKRIVVSDEGHGIPLDELEAVFERFYQVRSNQVASRRGAGVGLSIVRSYVEAMNGRVWVESPSDSGAVFTVEFP